MDSPLKAPYVLFRTRGHFWDYSILSTPKFLDFASSKKINWYEIYLNLDFKPEAKISSIEICSNNLFVLTKLVSDGRIDEYGREIDTFVAIFSIRINDLTASIDVYSDKEVSRLMELSKEAHMLPIENNGIRNVHELFGLKPDDNYIVKKKTFWTSHKAYIIALVTLSISLAIWAFNY